MNIKKIRNLLHSITNNANWVMDSWRAGSDEAYYVQQINRDVQSINQLLDD